MSAFEDLIPEKTGGTSAFEDLVPSKRTSAFSDLVPTEKPSTSEKVAAGFESGLNNTLAANAEDLATQNTGGGLRVDGKRVTHPSNTTIPFFAGGMKTPGPLGAVTSIGNVAYQFFKKHQEGKVKSMSELIPGYEEMTPDQRRTAINQLDREQLKEDHPNVIGTEHEDSGAFITGKILGMMADPSTAIPGASGTKAFHSMNALKNAGIITKIPKAVHAANIGKVGGITAGLVGADVAIWQKAKEGEIDPVTVAAAAGLGFVAGPSLFYFGHGIGNFFSPKDAAKTVKKYEQEVAKNVLKGMKSSDAEAAALRHLDLSDADLFELAAKNKEGILRIATDAKEAKKIFGPIQQATNKIYKNTIGRIQMPESVDKFIGVLSTRIKNINPRAFGMMRRMVYDQHRMFATWVDDLNPLLDHSKGLFHRIKKSANKKDWKTFKKALMNGNREETERLAKKVAGQHGVDSLQSWYKIRQDISDNLRAVGYTFDEIDDYFPRIIKDYDGLAKDLKRAGFDHMAERAKALKSEIRAGKKTVDEAALEMDRVVRGKIVLQGKRELDNVLGSVKKRKIEKLWDDIERHYADPDEALVEYLNKSSGDIMKRTFLGRHVKPIREMAEDVPASIDSALRDPESNIGRLLVEESLSDSEIARLTDLITSFFTANEKGAHKVIKNARNMANMVLLGNPRAAIVQTGDIAVSAIAQGPINTARAVFRQLTGRSLANVRDDIFVRQIMEELASTTAFSKWTQRSFDFSGFSAVDRFGKNTNINAALLKGIKQTKIGNTKGINALRKKYEGVLSDKELFDLVDDLANFNERGLTDNIKFYLFNELSDVQPITRLEVPQKYLDSPNGRIFYQFKTFAIKQMDIVRRLAIQEIKKGNPIKGMVNLGKFVALMTAGAMPATFINEWIRTGEVNVDEVPDTAFMNVMRIFGWNEYVFNRPEFKKNPVQTAIHGTLLTMPPVAVLERIMNTLFSEHPEEVVENIPIIGQIMWYWLLGGAEVEAERLKEFRRKQEE